jgi:hypothetical protein
MGVEIWLHLFDTLALLVIVFLLASKRLIGAPGRGGRDGEPGKDGLDGRGGKDGADGKDGLSGKDGLDGKDGAPGQDARQRQTAPDMVQILHNGVPYHQVPIGSRFHKEALTGLRGLSVRED